jgi:hypothetical protein
MSRLVLLATLLAACSKSAPEAETQSVQPPPPSDEGGADPLDGVARERAQEPVLVPPEEPPPSEEQALEPTVDDRRERETASGRRDPDPTTEPMPTGEDRPVAHPRHRRPTGTTREEAQGALQLDE